MVVCVRGHTHNKVSFCGCVSCMRVRAHTFCYKPDRCRAKFGDRKKSRASAHTHTYHTQSYTWRCR